MTKKISEKKQEELKKLSKKYFWEQKTNEVSMFVLIVLGIIAVLYICSSIFLMISPEGVLCNADTEDYCNGVFGTGLVGLFSLFIICSFLFAIGYIIYIWIKNNKEKAEERAKKELGIKDNHWGR